MIVLEPNKEWVQRVSQGVDHTRLFLNDPFLGAMYTTAPGPVVTSSSSILPAKVGGCASGAVLELEITTPGSGYAGSVDGAVVGVGRIAAHNSQGVGLTVRVTVTNGCVTSARIVDPGVKYRKGDVFTVKRPLKTTRGPPAIIVVSAVTERVGQPGTTRVCGDVIRGDSVAPAARDVLDRVVRHRRLACRCISCKLAGSPSYVDEIYTAISCQHGAVYVAINRGQHCDYTVDSAPSECGKKLALLPHHKAQLRQSTTAGVSPAAAYAKIKSADKACGSRYLDAATDTRAVQYTMKNVRRSMRSGRESGGEAKPMGPIESAMHLCQRQLKLAPAQDQGGDRPYLLWCQPPDFTLPRDDPLGHMNVVVIFSATRFEEYLAESIDDYGTVIFGSDAKVALVANEIYLVLLAIFVKAPENPLYPDGTRGHRCRIYGAALTTSEMASFYSKTLTKVNGFRKCESPGCAHKVTLVDRGPGREAYLCRLECAANRVAASLQGVPLGVGVREGVVALATGVARPGATAANPADIQAAWHQTWAQTLVEQDLLGSAAAGVAAVGATSTGCGFHDAAAVIEKLDELRFISESMLAALVVVRRMRLATSWQMTRDMFTVLREGLRKSWVKLGEPHAKIQAALLYLERTRYCASHCAQMTATGKQQVNDLVRRDTGVDYNIAATGPATNNGVEEKIKLVVLFCDRKVIVGVTDAITKLTGVAVSGECLPEGHSLADKFLEADRKNRQPPEPSRSYVNATKGGCALLGLGHVSPLKDTVLGAPSNLIYVRSSMVYVYPYGDDDFWKAGGTLFSDRLDDLLAALRVTDDMMFDGRVFPRKPGYMRVDTDKDWVDSSDRTALLHRDSSTKFAARAYNRGQTPEQAYDRLGQIMRRRAQQLDDENYDRLHSDEWSDMDDNAVGAYCAQKMTEKPLRRETRAAAFEEGLNDSAGPAHVLAMKAKLAKKKKETDTALQKARWAYRKTDSRKVPLAMAGGRKPAKHINTDSSHRGRNSALQKRRKRELVAAQREETRASASPASTASKGTAQNDGDTAKKDGDTIFIS